MDFMYYTFILYRVRLNKSWFFIQDKVLNFHDFFEFSWVFCYHKPFHDKIKRSMELSMDLWHLNKMKVILTLWTMNYAFFCVPFSCIDSFQVCQIACHACHHGNLVCVPMCFGASMVYVLVWLCAGLVHVHTCQCVKSMPTFHFYVPAFHKAYQHVKWSAKF